MRVIHSLSDLDSEAPSVVTVGNFDGVHRGHQAILSTVRHRASRLRMRAVAMTFEPHPLECVAPERAPIPILTLEQKIRLIQDSGIDVLLIQKFQEAFSRISPETFVKTYLIEGFRAQAVCVGQNFRFGHAHRGDVETLRRADASFEVVEVAAATLGRGAISSSRIRSALLNGGVREARRMLGRCYEISGTIVAGKGRGRRITVPTLNLESENKLVPADGVYLTRISGDGQPFVDSVTNVGVRPTFGEGARTIETHLLEAIPFEGPRGVRLRFVGRLRDERRFPDARALRIQIERDRKRAHRFFRRFEDLDSPTILERTAENR